MIRAITKKILSVMTILLCLLAWKYGIPTSQPHITTTSIDFPEDPDKFPPNPRVFGHESWKGSPGKLYTTFTIEKNTDFKCICFNKIQITELDCMWPRKTPNYCLIMLDKDFASISLTPNTLTEGNKKIGATPPGTYWISLYNGVIHIGKGNVYYGTKPLYTYKAPKNLNDLMYVAFGCDDKPQTYSNIKVVSLASPPPKKHQRQ